MKRIKMKINKFLLLVIVVSFFSACNNDDSKPAKVTQRQVIANYAYIVCMSYKDSYGKAIKMQQSINAFLEAPTTDGFEKIKEDWKEARKVYGQTEAYLETNSPVDVAKTARVPWGINNERQMNAWPIDESYIDYVAAGT